jgi:branched-subunit amino acid ABC-type transport system permease component
MHVLVLSLFVALVACVLLLGAFWLFTITPLGRRIEGSRRSRRPRLG